MVGDEVVLVVVVEVDGVELLDGSGVLVVVVDLSFNEPKRDLVCNRFHQGNRAVVVGGPTVVMEVDSVVDEVVLVVVVELLDGSGVLVVVMVVVVVVVEVVLFNRFRRSLQVGFSVVVGTKFHHFLVMDGGFENGFLYKCFHIIFNFAKFLNKNRRCMLFVISKHAKKHHAHLISRKPM